MLVKVLIGAALVVVVLLIVIALQQPSEFRVVRTASIGAPPAAVFPHLNDFHKWDAWSPWAKLDPGMKTTFGGPPEGTGATMEWSGNNEVGAGQMTIVESRPNELVRIRLDFKKPFAGTSTAEFTLTPQGDRTQVAWSLAGPKTFMSKAVGLVMNMDRMIGGMFERGLASLTSVVEASAKR